MRWLLTAYSRFLELLLVIMLAAMVVLVFGNVVLRYAFDSGIVVSEEVSRWLFVWMTMLGAVVALLRNAHLGTDFVTARLGPTGAKVCLIVSHALMIYVTWLLLDGLWVQTVININVAAPVTGAPMAIVYIAGLAFSVSALVVLAVRLVAGLRGKTLLIEATHTEVADGPDRNVRQ
jgi:TRAP-type C4-dicarboxylate transport system permease small subunit